MAPTKPKEPKVNLIDACFYEDFFFLILATTLTI